MPNTPSVAPFTCAASTSSRRKPHVQLPRAGRCAITAAPSAIASAAASVSMWPASASSASECASSPAVTSTAIRSTISPSARPSRRRSRAVSTVTPCEWPWWWWPCAIEELTLRPGARALYRCGMGGRSSPVRRLTAVGAAVVGLLAVVALASRGGLGGGGRGAPPSATLLDYGFTIFVVLYVLAIPFVIWAYLIQQR